MIHIYKQGKQDTKYTILVLHGTGGDETDLLPLVEEIAPQSNILSVRGNVLENGMARFFKRKAPGVFDMESLEKETVNLRNFLKEASQKYNFDLNHVIAFGYSNGANIAANLLMSFEGVLEGAILLHPMIPNPDANLPYLKGVKILITAGKVDTMVPYKDAVTLQEWFTQYDAQVQLLSTNYGHQIIQEEILKARDFLQNNFFNK